MLARTVRNIRPSSTAILIVKRAMSRYYNIADSFLDDRLEFEKHIKNFDNINISILFQNESFLVIDKPYDLRMDGEYEVTLEKVLQSKFGTDSCYKWVHQLDFATSGALCIGNNPAYRIDHPNRSFDSGKNRPGAGVASQAFEQRRVVKEYLSLVHGHIILDKNWQNITSSQIPYFRDQAMKEIQSNNESIQKTASGDKSTGWVSFNICVFPAITYLSTDPLAGTSQRRNVKNLH